MGPDTKIEVEVELWASEVGRDSLERRKMQTTEVGGSRHSQCGEVGIRRCLDNGWEFDVNGFKFFGVHVWVFFLVFLESIHCSLSDLHTSSSSLEDGPEWGREQDTHFLAVALIHWVIEWASVGWTWFTRLVIWKA